MQSRRPHGSYAMGHPKSYRSVRRRSAWSSNVTGPSPAAEYAAATGPAVSAASAVARSGAPYGVGVGCAATAATVAAPAAAVNSGGCGSELPPSPAAAVCRSSATAVRQLIHST